VKAAFWIFVVIVGCVVYGISHSDSTTASAPAATSSYSAPAYEPSAQTSDVPAPGDPQFGSGHQAGYDWAQEHGIDDEDACETAGNNSNSPSFAEGCKAYVQENDPSGDNN
jgi:hypothetical protein